MTPATKLPTRIILVGSHGLYAESLEVVLRMDGYDVERMPWDDEKDPHHTHLLTSLLQAKPHLALLELTADGPWSGGGLIGPLTAHGVVTFIVTSETDRIQWSDWLALGVKKVISKEAPLSEIRVALRRWGNSHVTRPRTAPDGQTQRLPRRMTTDGEAWARLSHLTRREAEVLGSLMEGLQVSDIARERCVSQSTVRSQVKSVLAKLQVSSQLTAVSLAHKAGWFPPSTREGEARHTGGPRAFTDVGNLRRTSGY